MGDTIKSVKDKTWAECVVECDRYSTCTAFAYQKDLKLCYLKKSSDGEAIFKQNYIYSRFCGRRPETESAVTNEFNCPTRECRSCSTTGYTNELGYYSGASIKTVTKNKEGNKVTRDECAKECDMELDCVATRYNRNDSKIFPKNFLYSIVSHKNQDSKSILSNNQYCYLVSSVYGRATRSAGWEYQRRNCYIFIYFIYYYQGSELFNPVAVGWDRMVPKTLIAAIKPLKLNNFSKHIKIEIG